MIKNGINGSLIPVGDEKALRDEIDFLIENKDVATSRGREATRIREIVNEDTIFNQWKNYLEEVVEKACKSKI